MRNITPVSTPVSVQEETKFNGRALADAAAHYQTMVRFVQSQMQQDIDYGTVPGTKKPILLKLALKNSVSYLNSDPRLSLSNLWWTLTKPSFTTITAVPYTVTES